MSADNVKIAKDFLETNGYVVLRAKSYRQAQERQHIAEARAEWAEELRAGQDRWMREDVFPEQRRLRERLTFVYGVARARGATVEELSVMTPKRIQLRRTKGWRKPEGAVVVARPSKWGNPWRVGDGFQVVLEERLPEPGAAGRVIGPAEAMVGSFVHTPAIAVALYRLWAVEHFDADTIAQLRGRDLACWCPPSQPCHADVLLEIANRGEAS